MDREETKKMLQLIEFVNFDNKSNDKDYVLSLARKYVDITCQGEHAIEKYNHFSRSTFPGGENNTTEKLPELLEKIQTHLKTILDGIIDPRKALAPIKLKGEKTIRFKNHEMVEEFDAEKIWGQKIALEEEKRIAEAALIELIINEKVELKKIKKCRYCGNYLYDAKKLDCSIKCGNSYRQKEYQKSHKTGKKKKKTDPSIPK